MTRDEFIAVLEPLVIALRAEFDLPTWTVYYRALQEVPVPALQAAITRRLTRGRQEYEPAFPEPGTIREWADQARMQLLEAHPYRPCEACSFTGWAEITDGTTVRVTRCSCWTAHQAQVARLGLGPAIAAPKRLASEFERFDARMAQTGER